MAETFVMRIEGGPTPGQFAVDETQYPWPLPGILRSAAGAYVKVSESMAPPAAAGDHYVRGARYQWYTDEQIEEAKSAQAQD